MAILTWTYDGLANVLDGVSNQGLGTNLRLRLYTNNHAVVVGDVWAALTECALAGYAFALTVPANWTITTAAPVGYSVATYPAVTFTFNAYAGGVTIFGFAITTTANLLLVGGLLDTAFVVPAGGGSLTINLTLNVVQA
jgi:hypothetical protein